ncbi:MAG: ABC transporter permease [Oscillospiraceae bacterium]|jgi:ABC-type dipeptide/oligopeptide/nickel transport system permease component|uniref:ABC transporter permease n=1 Tax=Anaerotruncus rubiinfantis TaxID=1720200 RepID=UPI001FAE15B4|nr:ABC transporter permease [Anaerotruncus rubiinfantis]MDD3165395.1 ABC transporter permease [Oscillospiraceae bacterium]
MLRYLGKRLLVFIPLFFGVIFVAFVLIRMLPGDPAHVLAGAFAYEDTIAALTEKMGLDKPVLQQFFIYIGDVFRGDLGRSMFTSSNVLDDLIKRFPATFELITLSIMVSLVLGMFLAVFSVTKPKGVVAKISNVYGMLAGSFADFWLALILIYIFFTVLGIAPAPIGRLDVIMIPPQRITGMYLLDSILTGNWAAFKNAAQHLALPVITLGLINGAAIMKMTHSTMGEVLDSDFIHHARLMGLAPKVVRGYALKNSLPAVLMVIGNIYSYLLGGAVLIEQVFAWGGLGQYVTQALSNKDYVAIQGFILVATLFSMVLYLILDLIQMIIDPRIKY